ncbi:MAG: hypothetical protein F6K58_14235 [Symploca sp. SIO2E9]|nr:hypothetical protein [Symploca sp. SIO2E9]
MTELRLVEGRGGDGERGGWGDGEMGRGNELSRHALSPKFLIIQSDQIYSDKIK